jgi:AraC-like DNA-binding protein
MSGRLGNGGIWIQGTLGDPPQGLTGPLVFGPDWLLEMLQGDDGRTLGLYWAPFAIVREFPKPHSVLRGRFIGFSLPTKPPASWLTTSMVFDLGETSLVSTPEEFIALIKEPRDYLSMEGSAKPSPLSQQAKACIASHYRDDLSIAEVACQLGVSHAHLSRQFKRDFGLTPINYLHRLRVTEAIGKLSLGEGPLNVGYDVGFNDTSRFYREFLKITGTSPGKCKREVQRLSSLA